MDPAKAQAHVRAQQAQQAVATAATAASSAISPGAFAALGAPASASRSSANPAIASAIASGPVPQVAPAGFVQTRATSGSTRPGSPDVAGDTLAFDRILGGSTQAELQSDRVTGLRYVVKQGGLQTGGRGGRRGVPPPIRRSRTSMSGRKSPPTASTPPSGCRSRRRRGTPMPRD